MAHLFDLPAEIVLLFASLLDHSDITRLVQTCRYAQRLLTRTLYAIGCKTALLWAVAKNKKQTAKNALRFGRPKLPVLFRALVGAAQLGNVEITELLLNHGAPTELEFEREGGQPPAGLFFFDEGPSKDSPLVAAIVADYPEIVSLLLDRGARTDVADRHGWLPLHHACHQHTTQSCVSLLIAAGANVHARSWDGTTAGELAAGEGSNASALSSGILRALLTATNGRILADRTTSGESIARHVISNGDGECQRLVLEFGMPLMPAISPSELLLAAATVGDEGFVSEILEQRDLDVQGTTDLEGNNAPMLAAKHGHSSVFQTIAPHVPRDGHTWRSRDGESVLHLAISSGDLETVITIACFVATTPKVFNSRDRRGRTPLLLATQCKTQNLDIIRLLMSHGADVEVIDTSGSSPIHNAAHHGHVETTRFLLNTLNNLPSSADGPRTILKPSARLASIFRRDNRIPDDDELLAMHQKPPQIPNRNPFSFGAPTFAHVVTRQGPLINLVDDNGFTPLALALRGKHADVAQLLTEHGAVSLDEARKLRQNAWFTGLKKALGYGHS
jgi:ankyrin repeat protein